MSEGPIKRERLATTAEPIPSWRVGQVVIPEAHPADHDRWRVVATDGAYVDLEPDEMGRSAVKRIRRHARTLRATS